MGRKYILIVEDDKDLRETLFSYLELIFPGNIIQAEEGKQALDLIYGGAGSNVVTIITDINMPNGMGGKEFLNFLKVESHPALKIAISGYIKNKEDDDISALCDYFFEKPVSLRDLVKLIKDRINIT